ncbi:GAP1-N2 domain-containing protein [Actinomadura algeriensis]|uniref:HEAT repeat protein n=1 Tax=Actinomadura algeriensis TaxID=1679523 RepID=A0ABR9K4B0_9ACTN|nr:hypothetical protein [Actinomadura algeriensis]MBE1537406.1 hypothetical protein [Actinomadura algeriensis]
MAWQLHYTSVRRGPTGRSGFQFVAETPGLPDGARAGVLPHLSYRPPPEAPAEPGDADLDRFPVSLLYDRVDGRPVLVRCRYLGRDYSGRYGNFFGHAVIAGPGELEGVRPAELWRSPLWDVRGAADGRLDEPDELPPGEALGPADLARWLPASGPADPFGTLGFLVHAAGERIAAGDGRVVLVADDVETIARWIALVSYSLPLAAAERLTFVTYSADPQRAAQHIVGTTPGVWADARHHASHALAVDLRTGVPDAPPSRFARAVTGCWHDADFAGLDALAELAELDGLGSEGAAVLLALCRTTDATVTADEQRAFAELLAARRPALPEWAWRELAPRVPSLPLELAVVVRAGAAEAGLTEVARQCELRVAMLALSDPAAREHLPAARPADSPPSTTPGPADPTSPPGPAHAAGSSGSSDAAGAARHVGAAADGDARAELIVRVPAALAAAPDLGEVAAVATVAVRAGVPLGADEIADAASACVRRGARDLPAALAACPAGLRAALVDGAVTGLAESGARGLEPDMCDTLYEYPDRLRDAPHVAVPVLASVGNRHPGRRLEATAALLNLAARDPRNPPAPREGADAGRAAGPDAGDPRLDSAFGEVWVSPPSVAECTELLDAHGGAVGAYPALAVLARRTFGRLAEGAFTEAGVLRLAARVEAVLPGAAAAGDAAVVRAHADAVTADRPGAAAKALGALVGAGAAGRLADAAFGGAARRLCRRPPEFRAALLAGLDERVRARLAECWTDGLPARTRAGRTPLRGAEIEQRNELVEVVLRLRERDVREPGLEEWARACFRGQAGRWLAGRQLDAYLAPELRPALRELIAEGR